jgi:hypothetical protein
MEIKFDGKGQPYIDVENTRITFKQQVWSLGPGLSFRAYKGNDSGLHMGTEIPLESHKVACELITAIGYLVAMNL